MYGTAEDLNDSNYKIFSKKIEIDLINNLSLSYFENKMSYSGSSLLRWAIIDIRDNVATVYATYISREEIYNDHNSV